MAPLTDPLTPFVPGLPALTAVAGAPLYLTADDHLLVTVKNAAAGVTVTIGYRTFAVGDDQASPGGQTIIPATDRSDSTTVVLLPAGWLLSVQAKVTIGAPLTGQTWVRFSLVHGQTATAPELFTLCSGYVTAKKPLSYPGGLLVDSLDGAGALRSITGTTPGAGAEISEVVPTGARWQVLAFHAQLVTSATVANRIPAFLLDDGANVYGRFAVAQALTASATWFPQLDAGSSRITVEASTMGYAFAPSPTFLLAGHRIRTLTAAIQAADQYSAVQYLVREWIEGS